MATRLVLFAAASLAIGSTLFVPRAWAQDPPSQEVETAKQQWIGVINASAVYVRSSAREDAYPVMKLDKGARVTVAGIKFKWLKIVPPEGSFGYVPKAYVERHGTGSVGRATREIVAKVGSNLNQIKTNPMATVSQGQEVQILDDQDEYYKIKPPEGSFLYINEQFVDPYKPVGSEDAPAQPQAPRLPVVTKINTSTPGTGTKQEIVEKLANGSGKAPSTQPSGEVAEAPSTQPSDPVTAATESFDKLEGDFKAANEKKITEQPVAELMTGYEDLLKQDALPTSMRRVAESRIATLKLRNTAKEEFVATKAAQQKAMERRKSLEAEREEITDRIKQNEITVYAAVGTLRTSSLQRGNQTLYRLTDPTTGRTVAYIRTTEPKYAAMLGQFIGVKGVVTTDSALNMKMIEQPSEAGPVDQSKVNKTITAQIVPPSLVPTVRSASTGGD